MSKQLIHTDDNGYDRVLSNPPNLIGLNHTEWWWLQEVMEHQKCKYQSSGFNEVFVDIVTIPGGEQYEITECMEVIISVKKL